MEEMEAKGGGREGGKEGGSEGGREGWLGTATGQRNVHNAVVVEAMVHEGGEGGEEGAGEKKELTALEPLDMPSLEDLENYFFGEEEWG